MSYLTIENHPRRKWIVQQLGKLGMDGITYTTIAAQLRGEISPSALSRYRREVMPSLIAKSEKRRVVSVEAELNRVMASDELLEMSRDKLERTIQTDPDKLDIKEALSIAAETRQGGYWRGHLGQWWKESLEINDGQSVNAIRELVADTVVALQGHPEALEAFRQVVLARKIVATPDDVDNDADDIVDHERAPLPASAEPEAADDMELPEW